SAIRPGAIDQTVVAEKILRRMWRAVLLEILWRPTNDPLRGAELSRNEFRIGDMAHPHGDIDVIENWIAPLVCQGDIHAEVGKLLEKRRKGGNNYSRAGCDPRRHCENPFNSFLERLCIRLRVVEVAENQTGALIEAPPRFR